MSRYPCVRRLSPVSYHCRQVALLCNNADFTGDTLKGTPTEGALLVAAKKVRERDALASRERCWKC